MSVPRIARIHLVYQFIILTLIIFAISCNEILNDKRLLFLALIPIFSYQLLIVFFCTELLPLPNWFIWTETQNEIPISQDQTTNNTGSGAAETTPSEASESPKESNTRSPSRIPRARLSTKNKETSDAVTSSDANTQTVRQGITDVFKKAPAFTKASARRSESTKSYCFSLGENRFEDRLDNKGVVRPYRNRNWRSLQDHKGAKSQSNLISSSQPVEETKDVISPTKLATLEESIESDSTDLSRSYSFPFRQRKQSRVIELEDNLTNDLNIPAMPAWDAVDYFSSSNTNKRRKSISTEAIDRELRLINSHFENNAKNDFTQSMEVAKESIVEPSVSKRPLKSSASFNKWKQGISSYFNKTKRENIKVDDTKHDDYNKKPFFKELFSSKDNLYQGPEKKSVSSTKSNSPFPVSDNRVKLSNRSPSYISYEADYF